MINAALNLKIAGNLIKNASATHGNVYKNAHSDACIHPLRVYNDVEIK